MPFCSLFRIPHCDLFGCVNALFFSGSFKNNDTSVSCTCPEVWLPWSNRIAITPPQSPHPILISGEGNEHHAGVPSFSPTPPLSFFLWRSAEGPLGGAGGGARGGVGSGLAHGLIGHDSGGELGLGLLETGIRLPVHAVDLSEEEHRGVDTRYGLAVHRHIAALCAAAGGKMIRRT